MPEQNQTPPQDPPQAPAPSGQGGTTTTVDPPTVKGPDGAMGLGDDEEES